MADLNLVLLEGTISGKFHLQEDIPGKEVGAVNFMLVNTNDKGKEFRYAVVAWRSDPEKFMESFQDKDYVRIMGHQQATPTPIGDGKVAYLSKICADRVDLLFRPVQE